MQRAQGFHLGHMAPPGHTLALPTHPCPRLNGKMGFTTCDPVTQLHRSRWALSRQEVGVDRTLKRLRLDGESGSEEAAGMFRTHLRLGAQQTSEAGAAKSSMALGVGWGSPLAPSRKEPSVLTLTVGGGSRAFPELRRRRPPAQEPHRCLKTETYRLVYGLTQNPPWKLPENTRGGVGLGCELLWPGVRAVKFLSICCLSVKWK